MWVTAARPAAPTRPCRASRAAGSPTPARAPRASSSPLTSRCTGPAAGDRADGGGDPLRARPARLQGRALHASATSHATTRQPQAGTYDLRTCFSNAKAYARNLDVIGVIGAYNSGCSDVQIPVANQAPDGPLAMISTSNTYDFLTMDDTLYPTGRRNFVRIAAPMRLQAAGLAQQAKELGKRRLFVVWPASDDEERATATDVRTAAAASGSIRSDSPATTPGPFATSPGRSPARGRVTRSSSPAPCRPSRAHSSGTLRSHLGRGRGPARAGRLRAHR